MIRWTVVALAARPDTQTIHPHLTGVRAPVRGEDDVEAQVVGRIHDHGMDVLGPPLTGEWKVDEDGRIIQTA